ncbi:MAG: formate dehydrogenase [Caldimonas sp.]
MNAVKLGQSPAEPEARSAPVGRRGLVIGAGAAGAAAVAAQLLVRGRGEVPAAAAAKTAAATGEGYQLTPHVLRYYETTKA